MTGTQILYILMAAATLACAYGVVAAGRLVHSALWLGATFLGMAGLFVLLEADFLAAAQVLIYVGAITTIILFGIMLSDIRDLRAPGEGSWGRRLVQLVAHPRRGLLPLLAAAGFAVALAVLTRRVPWPQEPPPAGGSLTSAIGKVLFSEFVLPFEVASVVLLVALVGAVVLAMREEAGRR